jgi:hypothetical protein
VTKRSELTAAERAACLMRWHDGETSDDERELVEQLLEQELAGEQLASFELVGELVREADRARVPEVDLTEQVMARVFEAAPSAVAVKPLRNNVRALPRRALAAVAVALALAAGGALLVSERSSKLVASDQDLAAPIAAISAPEPDPPGESVAVERVDFGNEQGAIFLVPGVDERTVVIWTMDDTADADEDQEVGL